ncbi:MAG: MBL fold metallo-hydrolase [bacterium]|nr:MBL fold metallo-hydrolase [bacterium]
MILEQHYLECLAQASYLLFDEKTKTACVVDPRRDVDVYLERIAALGGTIQHVILTHFHADFLAGHLELRERTGATIHLGARAAADYDFAPLSEGDEVQFGDVRIAVLETPGHTPESISLLVYDDAVDATKPNAVLTGDTLFIGDVGRPDLMASAGITSQELAGMLYDSLRDKLLPLPDETLVYPGHGAGSACGKNLSSESVSTIGAQRAMNYALQPMAKEEFVATLTTGLSKPPAYFPVTAGLNKAGHAHLTDVIDTSLRPLKLAELEEAHAAGATVLDARSNDAFAAGHFCGSVNIGLDGKFASWAGTLLSFDAPIVVVTDPGDERTAVLRLGRIGFDRVLGFLEGGGAAFGATSAIESATTTELARRVAAGEELAVLDVRMPGEWDTQHLEGATHVPLGELEARLGEVPEAAPLYVHCKTGYRSMTACSLLARAGRTNMIDVAGGIEAWTDAKLGHLVGEGCTS